MKRKFTKYPVHGAEGAAFSIIMYVSGERHGYLYGASQSRGTFVLRVSTNIEDAKQYASASSAKKAYANYRYANEIFVYDNTSMPVEQWFLHLREGAENDKLKKWDSRVEFKIEPLQTTLTGSYTIESIEKARETEIQSFQITAMHSAIQGHLDYNYPDLYLFAYVREDRSEYRPSILVDISPVLEPNPVLKYKVYVDDPTVTYSVDGSCIEADLGVDPNLAEVVNSKVAKYLKSYI